MTEEKAANAIAFGTNVKTPNRMVPPRSRVVLC